MIHYLTPYSLEKDLGKAYNQAASLITNQEDWLCLLDADTAFLSPDFGHQIQEIISLNPDVGLLTCVTNRIGNLDQAYNGIISEETDILKHRQIALDLAKSKRHRVKKIPNPISGHLMLLKKATWDIIGGAPEGRGILSIDNTISNRVVRNGFDILLMEGVYLFHFYRLDTGRHNKSHLK
jgi:GT2 family glycosyltransferase